MLMIMYWRELLDLAFCLHVSIWRHIGRVGVCLGWALLRAAGSTGTAGGIWPTADGRGYS